MSKLFADDTMRQSLRYILPAVLLVAGVGLLGWRSGWFESQPKDNPKEIDPAPQDTSGLEKFGAKIERDKARGNPVVAVSLNGGFVKDEAMLLVKDLTTLRRLDFSNTAVTDAGLDAIKGLTELRELALDRTRITDAGVAKLVELTNLEVLTLSGCSEITDKSAGVFAKFPALRMLKVNATGLGNSSIATIATLEKLIELDLRSTAISDGSMKTLTNCKSLRELRLAYCKDVTSEGMKHLAELTTLEWLDLERLNLTDASLKHLAGLKSLRKLSLADNELIGDNGIAALSGLALTALDLSGTKATGTKLGAFKEMTELLLERADVSDATLAVIKELPKMRVLRLATFGDDKRITDAGLTSIAEMKRLEELKLWVAGPTGKGIRKLVALTQLKKLELRPSEDVAEADLDVLRRALPKCVIEGG